MLTYSSLSPENIEEAITLVYSVFPDDFDSSDSPEEAYRASIDRENHKEFLGKHALEKLEYFVVKNSPLKKIIGVTGWYTRTVDPKDVIWLGWYCLDKHERGKGFGKEILEWTISQVKQKGYRVLRLYTTTDPNEATAQIVYEDLGFKLIKEESVPLDQFMRESSDAYTTLYRERVL
jgi:GNAT superfamily N-acetyltransferase